MVQLKILAGKKAGSTFVARRFPVHIGRAPNNELQLEDDGVWDQHLELAFDKTDGFVLSANGGGLAAVNGEPTQQTILRNGDLIQLGSLKLQFWLGEPRQVGLALREWLVWCGIVAVCALQIALIYLLLR